MKAPLTQTGGRRFSYQRKGETMGNNLQKAWDRVRKWILRPLLSMRTANLLMAVLALLCGVSSLIPQGEEAAFYAANYPGKSALIRGLYLDDVFHSWYFVALMGLLCLSMLLCTGRMLVKALRAGKNQIERAAALPNTRTLRPGDLEKLRRHMAAIRCRETEAGESLVFHKNGFGRFGSFLIHAAILLVVLFGVGALYLPRVQDLDCRVGESVTLFDGTEIEVLSFRMQDESGKLDYASEIRITLPDGQRSPVREIKVNVPASFGRVKVFQWTYGVGGAVSASNPVTGEEDLFELEEPVFLSEDGLTGLQVLGVYEARAEDGQDSYLFYQVRIVSNGTVMPDMQVQPGEEIKLGDWVFRFHEPYYPGLRAKIMPIPVSNSLLEIAMLLLLAGLFLSFYLQPVLVKADAEGYTVAGPRPEKMRLELEKLLAEPEEGDKA